MVDALCDLLYVTYGAAVDLGVDLQPFFAEVHRSNMAKVGGRKREDGKWLKPAGWTPPDIAGLLSRLYGLDASPAEAPTAEASTVAPRQTRP
jgi:predicted HAD superfamily Cof-like phosphohydrolase